jgi:hypothetical protein
VSELQSADSESILWLRASSDDGVEVTGATPYIALLIDRARRRERASSEGD